MLIKVNQAEVELNCSMTLEALLEHLNLANPGMALAQNQIIIPKTSWSTTQVCDGDEIDLFQAIAGG
ncbi:MAG: sulfur carrier protein ThiS [Vibrio sp.]